jgi:phosphoglycerate kinase
MDGWCSDSFRIGEIHCEMKSFRTLDDVDLTGKRVLLRVDLNVPMENGKVSDATRIERVAPTITEIADRGGKVILLAHFGRPKGPDPKDSLKPVAAEVAKIIGRPVAFAADCIGATAQAAVAAMKPGDVLCLENTRFHQGEEKNDPAFVAALAKLGDLWVNDAFSAAHRAHASTEGLGHKLPAYAGRSMQAELEALTKALEAPQRLVAAIVGGAKVSTKLDLLGNLVEKVDVLMIGGGMANTFLSALGKPVGKSLAEHDLAGTAREILAKAKDKGCEIVLPVDAVVAQKFEAHAPSRVVGVDGVGSDDMILDIGPRSVEHVISVLARVKTLVWNGPIGAFELEPFDNGTVEVAEAAAELTAAGKLVSVAGGGDTVAALNTAGVADRFSYVSTAGGAFLEWMEGKPLPGVEVLKGR